MQKCRRFPKMESKFYSFLSISQFSGFSQKWDKLPATDELSSKLAKTARALVHHDGARFLPEMEKRQMNDFQTKLSKSS